MSPKKRERVPVKSRQWSCSELVEGHDQLVSTKMERESDDEIQGKIQDPYEKHGGLSWGFSANIFTDQV